MKLSTDHHDSDSTHSPLDDNEKVVGVERGGFETLGRGQLPPDPDYGLSEEEKARIVSVPRCSRPSPASATHCSSGSQTPTETRPALDPLALSPLSHRLP